MSQTIFDMREVLIAAQAAQTEARSLLSSALSRLDQADAHLESLLKQSLKDLPASAVPMTEHRRRHRMGRTPKIDGDAELAAFITARLDRLTYIEIEKDVKDHFPPNRRVRKSAIYAWATTGNGSLKR